MQQHAYATQSAPSAYRPRSHYCGLHGWNNDHNGPECRAMARDPKFTMDMRHATTHEGTGGNPNVGVPVGFVRPNPISWSPPVSLSACLPCSRVDTCLFPPSRHTMMIPARVPRQPLSCARSLRGIDQLSYESLRLSLSPPPKCLLCLLVS